MTPEAVLTTGSQALQLALMLAAPLLLTALAVGVLVGVFQAATQINEQTLSFVPKILMITVAMVICGPWILHVMLNFTADLFNGIPEIGH